jgi:hypothetical protein
MESSQCLCHQTTPPFVGKGCVTFCFIFLTMKSLRNPKVDIVFSNIGQMKQIKT